MDDRPPEPDAPPSATRQTVDAPSAPPVAAAPAGASGTFDRGPLIAGVILIVVGLAFLLGRVVTVEFATWPLWVVVPGVAMLLGALFIPDRGGVGLAIPGGIVTTVGLVLWVQELTGAYATWAYAWALVAPGGVGVGMLLFGLVRGYADVRAAGFRTLLVGVGLFLGFAFFFEGVLGLSGERIAGLDTILPVAVVALGVIVLVLGLVGRRESGRTA